MGATDMFDIERFHKLCKQTYKCDKVFKNGPSKIWGRQPLKKLIGHIPSNFLKAVFHKF